MMIKKVLIANRGEIAIRIHHTLKKLGIKSAGIYSKDDEGSYHRFLLDECYYLGDGTLLQTYLNIEKIIKLAKEHECDAIHPGYGFLSENYEFAQACEKENIIFIGPSSYVIKQMGDKIQSKELAKKIGIPVLENITGTIEEILQKIQQGNLTLPCIIKASAGGGGKGMKILYQTTNIEEELLSSQREAKNYFGNDTIFIEPYLENPRHIEVQVLRDHHNNVLYLFERECSIQRRHQKIIEEAPSPTLSDEEREQLYEYAIKLIEEIQYTNAGTIEFLYDEKKKEFYFLEMNTRIQVEHPTTEMITGLDIVELQILIASKQALPIRQNDIQKNGHAIEVRVYAEDPESNFMPCPGKILTYIEPTLKNIRIDSSIKFPQEISSKFDPLISKMISWGVNREEARILAIHGLQNYIIHGVITNINYLIEVLNSKEFIENHIHTNFCNQFKRIENQAYLKEALLVTALNLKHKKKDKIKFHDEFHHIDIWQHIGRWSNV